MKKLALILGSIMILGAVAVNAQDKPMKQMKQMKDTTHMKSKKPVTTKKGTGTYQMKKKSVVPNQSTNEPMEDPSKIKSTGQPVYKK